MRISDWSSDVCSSDLSKTASTLKQGSKMSMEEAKKNRKAPPDTPSNLGSNASKDIAAALTALLADVFALHVTTKNCHWHISGQYFRDYHLLLEDRKSTRLNSSH